MTRMTTSFVLSCGGYGQERAGVALEEIRCSKEREYTRCIGGEGCIHQGTRNLREKRD